MNKGGVGEGWGGGEGDEYKRKRLRNGSQMETAN